MTSKVACVGVGTIGRSWAIAFAKAGYQVAIYDESSEVRDFAAQFIADRLEPDIRKNILSPRTLADTLKNSVYVQESIAENRSIKRALFKQLNDLAGDLTFFGSSSSAIPGSAFMGGLRISGRSMIVHPTNPPHIVPLTELCPTKWTLPEAYNQVRKLMRCIGQTPITIKKETTGFVLNRLQAALVREALCLVKDNIASPRDVDLAVSKGLGLRWSFMGPFETGHLNSPGGYREYMTKFRSTYQEMMDDLESDYQITDQLIHEIADEIETGIPINGLPDRQDWRDKSILALKKLLSTVTKPVKYPDQNQESS